MTDWHAVLQGTTGQIFMRRQMPLQMRWQAAPSTLPSCMSRQWMTLDMIG